MTKGVDVILTGFSFQAAVPRVVVLFAVVIVLPVFLVVLLIVAHQVEQRESVVSNDKVNRMKRFSPVLIEVCRTTYSRREFSHRPLVPFDKLADAVSILSIPFSPVSKMRKLSNLVETNCIPGLRNELDIPKSWIFRDSLDRWRRVQGRTILAACHLRREVKSKPVDSHLMNPVPYANMEPLRHDGVVQTDRIAASSIVVEFALFCNVVCLGGKPFEGKESRPKKRFAEFRCVIEDNV
mmetsp:Transcript_24928/g.35923  ORF Transcript_24928/g.35923 Transcript_24928/m.35923 type:complete len:238 (+) Transcript_24928:195-908(+)